MGSSTQTPAQTTQTSSPWAGVQPYLSQLYGNASGTIASDVGYQPYTGQTQVAEDPAVTAGINAQNQMANYNLTGFGSQDLYAPLGLGLSLTQTQGITPGIQGALGQLGTVGSQYGDIYNRALGQQNPYLQDILNTQGRQIQDRVGSQMSGAGRYGSGQYTDVMTRALAESANPILAQDYAQRQALQMQATQGLGQTAQTTADIYGQGLNRAGQWAQLTPQLQQAQYANAAALTGAGQYQQDRAQAQLNDQIAQYNAFQARPWEQLSRFANILSGAGGLGGTKVTAATPGQTSLTQRLLGGAVAGGGLGSIFGGVGAGVGALGGGLLGGFG